MVQIMISKNGKLRALAVEKNRERAFIFLASRYEFNQEELYRLACEGDLERGDFVFSIHDVPRELFKLRKETRCLKKQRFIMC